MVVWCECWSDRALSYSAVRIIWSSLSLLCRIQVDETSQLETWFTVGIGWVFHRCFEVSNTALDCVRSPQHFYLFHIFTAWVTSKLGKVGVWVRHGVEMLFTRCSISESCYECEHRTESSWSKRFPSRTSPISLLGQSLCRSSRMSPFKKSMFRVTAPLYLQTTIKRSLQILSTNLSWPTAAEAAELYTRWHSLNKF